LSVASRTNNELDSVGATFVANDPDGDPVTLAVSGLPSGLSASGGNVSGRIAHNAATVTTLKTSIQSRGFTVVVTATDSHGSRTTRSLTWTVRDTHRTMPNYIGQYGCRGCGGLPDIADISHPDPRCAADPAGDQNLIWRQGVAPGAVILWGQPITYWYGPAPSGGCENVAKGW
jgi:hypothetical protein